MQKYMKFFKFQASTMKKYFFQRKDTINYQNSQNLQVLIILFVLLIAIIVPRSKN